MVQRWKEDPSLHSCPRIKDAWQETKDMDYSETYRVEFLESDPLRDWESIDRCISLWDWAIEFAKINPKDFCVLDCGTKDGQFPNWLRKVIKGAIGVEFSEKYVKYAKEKGRPVVWGDVCNMDFDDGIYDLVFSHHLLGLTADYGKGLDEMFRVTKPGGYMITLNDVPGNPKKHFSYIKDNNVFNNFLIKHKDEIDTILWNTWWGPIPKEYVLFVRKKNEKN